MTLQEAKEKLYKCFEDSMSPRNLSLTEIERITLRVIALKAIVDILLYEKAESNQVNTSRSTFEQVE